MRHASNNPDAHPRSRSRSGRTAVAVATLIALSGAWHSSAGALTDATDATAAPASAAPPPEALDEPIATEFGLVQFDDRAACGTELAYVVNRIIVQSSASATTVTSAINAWLATAPILGAEATPDAVSTGVSGLLAPKAKKVDQIVMPSVDDDGPTMRPVWAFSWPGDRRDVVALARHLIETTGWRASPDYVTQLFDGHNIFRPDGIPQPSSALPVRRLAPAAQPLYGTGVRVHVYDSGLAGPANSTLMPNVRKINAVDNEVPDRLVKGFADFDSVGHGRAISSLIATLSPGTQVWNARVTRSGISTDFSSAKRLVTTFNTPRNSWPDILVTSFGTQACDLVQDAPGDEIFPVSLHAASEAVDRLSDALPADSVDMLIVASAGNHGTERREYPAGFSGIDAVVSVGALNATLDSDGNPLTSASRTAPVADFSARGDWVDFYAPGEGIVTLHVKNIEFVLRDEAGVEIDRTFIDGKAIVQGTSFAGPMVASLIADIMTSQGVDATAATTILRGSGAAPQPPCDGSATAAELGSGRAVALVSPNAAGHAPASPAPPQDVCP